MKRGEARRLLDRIAVLRHPCDLDLLTFFARHPRVLLPSESLAKFLGYDLKVIARSLDVLLDAGLLTRTQTSAHAARLYAFTPSGTDGDDWLAQILRLSSRPDGRRILRAALNHQPQNHRSGDPRRQLRPGTEQTPRGRFAWQGASNQVRLPNGPRAKRAGEHDD
jgi:hypothetical protein